MANKLKVSTKDESFNEILSNGDKELLSLSEASRWASEYLNRQISVSNISYLVQYGRIKKYGINGASFIKKTELKSYYDNYDKERVWKSILGDDLNWNLSFSKYKESETTKHVHRLHPYKGKFIPQLVEYFLDSHTDDFKKEIYFNRDDIILDPFCGSGTTLIQANELGMHAVGIDVSFFNAMITNVKIKEHDSFPIKQAVKKITDQLRAFQKTKQNIPFEKELLSELANFNSRFFPSPQYKRKINNQEIDEKKYAYEKEKEFLPFYEALLRKHDIKIHQNKDDTFLDKWYLLPVREEIDFLAQTFKDIHEENIKEVLAVILSRTIRSCRATSHADLGTLKKPVTSTYYCKKHGKICKPLFSTLSWWERYTQDTISRLEKFKKLKTETFQICLTGDSRTINIQEELEIKLPKLAKICGSTKIKGIFSSPPYVGLINYHSQHAYAYELFNFERKDQFEIGPLSKGQGKEARDSYTQGVALVLKNCKKYLQEDYSIFLVANDKYNLYPRIAELSQMKIVDQFKRPVLNRVEKDRSAYSEIIFHLKEK